METSWSDRALYAAPWRWCRDNICHTVVAPAPGVPAHIQERAKQVAELAIGSLAGAGVFGVELFLLPNDEVRRTACETSFASTP